MKRNFVIVGAGLTGISIAVLLKQKYADADITVYESERFPGGLLKQREYLGYYYDTGGHIWHTNNLDAHRFICSFCDLMPYIHRAKSVVDIDGDFVYLDWPICDSTLTAIKKKSPSLYRKIKKELSLLPANVSGNSFGECVRSMVGHTLYSLFIDGYTKKMWRMDPDEMLPDWAPKRISINDNRNFFQDKYQGYPVGGWEMMILNMIYRYSIKVVPSTLVSIDNVFDLIAGDSTQLILTCPLDIFLYGEYVLPYRCLCIDPHMKINTVNEQVDYATVNYGTMKVPILRSTNYGFFSKEYLYRGILPDVSVEADDMSCQIGTPDSIIAYPLYTKHSMSTYDTIRNEIEKRLSNVVFAGRMALYKYMNMDECVVNAMEVVNVL